MISIIKYTLGLGTLLIIGCQPAEWRASRTILTDVSAIGIAQVGDEIWLSDGNNNRLVTIDNDGAITSEIEEVERPMHMIEHDGELYVPSYGSDAILIKRGDQIDTLSVDIEMEAPASIDIRGDQVAIADFYNHRIVYHDGAKWSSFGTEGKADGEMYYPTDVQFHSDKIYVADAYNNRVQVFDLEGQHLQTIGADQKMNAATGIYVTDAEIFVTDFEHDRVLVFDHEGQVQQIIEQSLDKPVDAIMIGEELWVLNFKGKYISVLEK